MKKIINFCLPCFAVLFILSCGSGPGNDTVIQTKDGKVTVTDIKKASEQLQVAVADAEKRKQQRRERGDTLAMNYKDLQQFLPEVDGFEKKGNPSGESVTAPGLGSFSKAEQRYQKGDQQLEIDLVDYNQSVFGFSAATGMFGMNMQMENDREKSGTFETGIPDVKGYERIYKTEDKAEVNYAIADRFILTIKARGSNDAEALKNIAKSMRLSELAKK